MDKRLLLESKNLEDLRLERDTLQSDLESLDSNLNSLTGGRIKSLVVDKSRQINGDATNCDDMELDRGIKRGMSVSTSSSIDSQTRSPINRPTKKLSSVVVVSSHIKQAKLDNKLKREAILESQRNDKQVFDRNKRMFGMLLGTLHRFKTEETHRESITIKRSKVEEKLDMAVEEEKATVSKEVTKILELKREKEELLDKADAKLDIVNRYKNWENTNTHLCNYIQTETKPKIFWLPKEHNVQSERRLKETRDYFSLCVAERAAKFKKELDDLDTEFDSDHHI